MRPQGLLLIAALLLAASLSLQPVAAQETAAAEERGSATDAPADDESQETDINEDNYRRFMELRDQSRQQPSAPYAVLAPPSNLEKLGKLPEASQKHLRSELLDIMLEGGRWTPESADGEYPYTPSEAAKSDSLLRGMESEAWTELVENYHARESEIYQAGARARSATVTTDPGQAGSPGDVGEKRANGSAGLSGQPGGAETSEPSRDAGQTLNALEYLTAASANGASTAAGANSGTGSDTAPSSAASGQSAPDSQTPAAESGQSSAEETAANATASATSPSDAASTEASPSDSAAASTASASNAAQDAREQENPEASTQTEVEFESDDVIAIRDLKNIQGTGIRKPEKDKKENDGGKKDDEGR